MTSRLAEIREIEALKTISEDDTDKEIQEAAVKQKVSEWRNGVESSFDMNTPDLLPRMPKTSEQRVSSAINPQSDEI